MGITRYTLPQNNGNLPLSFFGGNNPIVLLDNIFFMIIYVIHKIGDNENSPNSLNVTVNYHYHGENRVINQ